MEKLQNEAEFAIDEAYNEGYKAGTLEWEPQFEAEKFKREILEVSLLEQKKNKVWQQPLLVIAGTSFGFFGGFFLKDIIKTGGN